LVKNRNADTPDAAADKAQDSNASSVDDYSYLHPSNLERKSDWPDEDCIGWHEDENEEEFSEEFPEKGSARGKHAKRARSWIHVKTWELSAWEKEDILKDMSEIAKTEYERARSAVTSGE
jgi:hypothetical protein